MEKTDEKEHLETYVNNKYAEANTTPNNDRNILRDGKEECQTPHTSTPPTTGSMAPPKGKLPRSCSKNQASPRSLVVRFSDIRSGLKKTSAAFSPSCSEVESPSRVSINDISKTLCTPSPRTQVKKDPAMDITPKTVTKRKVDLSSPGHQPRTTEDPASSLPLSKFEKRVSKAKCLLETFSQSSTVETITANPPPCAFPLPGSLQSPLTFYSKPRFTFEGLENSMSPTTWCSVEVDNSRLSDKDNRVLETPTYRDIRPQGFLGSSFKPTAKTDNSPYQIPLPQYSSPQICVLQRCEEMSAFTSTKPKQCSTSLVFPPNMLSPPPSQAPATRSEIMPPTKMAPPISPFPMLASPLVFSPAPSIEGLTPPTTPFDFNCLPPPYQKQMDASNKLLTVSNQVPVQTTVAWTPAAKKKKVPTATLR